jgi:hypothetical protein
MKLFTFVVIALMISGIAMAADVPTDAGDKAMVFMFNGLDDLGLEGYGGDYGFGMRYYIANGTALRIGLEFGSESYEDKELDMEGDMSSYGVMAMYEKHMEGPCSSVSPYWGLGAGWNTSAMKLTSDSDWVEMTETGFGFIGAMGFEWAFTGCMTLGGEYQLGLWKYSGETEEDIGGATDTYDEYEGSFMGVGTASVYLSVYW